MRIAGFIIREGINALRPGIAAVTARIETGTLRVVEGACPNLLHEAGLYRYSDDPADRRAEAPVDAHNQALSALRYLVSGVDADKLARLRTGKLGEAPASKPQPTSRPWLRLDNEALWAPVWTVYRDPPEWCR